MIVDSDPDADAEGSDWDDIDLLNTWGAPYYSTFTTPGRSRVSAGPVKASDRRVPMAKLLGFIEDIFEADDSLPDRDTMAEMQPGEVFSGPAETFFELMDLGSGSSYGMPLLKSSVLHKLLRLVLQCSRPLADMAKMKVTESSKKNVDLASIPQQELGRLLRILERTVKISGSIDPFPNNVRGSKSLTSSPTKPKKKTSVAVVASPERSPGICTPEVEDVAEEKGHDGLEDEDTATPAPAQNGSDAESFDELGTKMQILIRSLLAAECCFAILSGDQLAKPLLSEDLIRSCFDIVKVSLEKTLLPFVEACSGLAVTATHPILASLIQFLGPQKGKKQKLPIDPSTAAAVNSCLDLLAKLFRHTCSALSLVQRLVRLPSLAMSDSIVISAVYLAIGPFFVSEPEPSTSNSNSDAAKASAKGRAALTALGGANTMKTLRLPALNLLRNVFAKHAEQRQWMIEEILTSLTKVTDMKKNRRQYGLRNGKAIHSITALLMQLVQAATHGVQERGRAKRSKGERERADVIDEDEDDQEEKSEADLETLLNGPELDLVALRASMDGAAQSAKAIAVYLMQRVGQIKVTKSSQEMNYASIVENLIEDLLNALYLPDWPAAALLLSCFCRIFASYLEDPKSSPDSKGVALDHLGTVAARLRQSELSLAESPLPETGVEAEDRSARSENEMEEKGPEASNLQRLLLPWITATKNEKCLYEVKNTYAQVLSFLAEAGGDDQAAESAIEFLIAQVQYELSGALTKAKSDVNQALDEKAAALELVKMHEFVGSIEEVINSFNDWRPSDSDVFGASSEEDFKRAYRTAELVSQSCSLMVSYQFLRQQLLGALDGQAVGNRTKALRGLGSISVVDPDLLDEVSVRSAVEVRLSDQSIGVRETAVGLLGKYVLRKTEYIEAYYDHLAGRIHDAGLAVRKRALRLLKNIYFASRSRRITVDACVRIVRCIYDEDTTVQDLAIVTIGEMWLSLPTGGSEARNVKRKESPSPASLDLVGSATGFVADEDVDMPSGSEVQLSDKVAIIMAVAAQIRERPSPLEEVFRRLMKDRKDSEATELLEKLRVLTDSLIDDLVDATDASPAETVTRIKTVHLLVTTNPSILSITKAKLLLPYLKSAQTIEELQMMELLLKIFRACLPWMPKTASTFAESLEKSMTPLVSKPPVKPGSQVLQELIACYCTVIKTMTHNFTLLSRTLKACLGRLLQIRNKTASSKNFELDRPSSLIMSLTALLCEHGDFDEIRSKYPDAVKDINAISQRPIVDVVSETFLAIYKNSRSTVRSFALQNLGYLFRAHPTLMTRPAVVEIMDEIFATGSVQDRTSLLKIILEFLNSDAARRDPEGLRNVNAKKATPTAGKDKVDMSELVGNTESFAETGVGSAMMQRYADPVLKATLEIENTSLQRTASDILKFTVLQGLSHPIQCVPYLVALETTNDPHIRSRALHLHSHLSSKHASLVAARYLDCAKASFTFQLQLTKSPELLRGYHEDLQPTAKLHAWYTLLRDKRQSRLDFVKTIVKALDVNTAASECSQESILFARYIADNLATLDYKTLEELFVVIGDLRSILAVSGMQVLFMVQNAIGHKPLGQEVAPQPEGAADEPGTPPRPGEVNPIPTPAPTLHPLSDTEGCNIEEAESTKGVEVVKLTEMTDGQDGNGGEGQPLSEKEVEAKTYNLARMSIVMGTALILRNHLKWLYNLSEQKCAKFVPGKKQSAGADRPAVQRNVADPSMAALSFDEMPWGIIKMDSLEDAKTQMELFVRMVEDEGTMLEPDDPEVMMMMDG
ncbi:hypothetical protein IE53DRAFT_318176 [Violaceomyces palustris]|uniref:Uncharacterized protein n=1 Tax=Violaceomyces palustris TaxID=1673888 RepID=A0ACD0NTL8_9BASI|nr:hypothetical protein IE53DRAFT_318176 [Violaceomyces palustris]